MPHFLLTRIYITLWVTFWNYSNFFLLGTLRLRLGCFDAAALPRCPVFCHPGVSITLEMCVLELKDYLYNPIVWYRNNIWHITTTETVLRNDGYKCTWDFSCHLLIITFPSCIYWDNKGGIRCYNRCTYNIMPIKCSSIGQCRSLKW